MALLDFFRQNKKRNSAAIARERLQILVAHDRGRNGPSYLPQLQRDLLKVIRKYVEVDEDAVNVHLENEGSQEILELNIVLPER
ncbi:MAG: cell division topological specificity factor MinE [Gammaproteobacteria bacterium]|nr:MAG: cell division topological specificity factor MinE [Gammaproteobacteria bacterium]